MSSEYLDSKLGIQFPEHWGVIQKHIEDISTLSVLENQVYGRESKPPGMQIQFLINTDIATATYSGSDLDIRVRQGLVTKPSEILEAAQALNNYYMMADAAAREELPAIDFTHAFQDTAAEAIVEMSDVIYNALQMFLTNADYGEPLLEICAKNLDPQSLDTLIEVAKCKYNVRYRDGGVKNIQAENKTIRELLIEQGLDPIFQVLNTNRKSFRKLLKSILPKGREVADKLGVLNDSHGNDQGLKDYHLGAFLKF